MMPSLVGYLALGLALLAEGATNRSAIAMQSADATLALGALFGLVVVVVDRFRDPMQMTNGQEG